MTNSIKIIPKNDEGILLIISLLNKVLAHNENFFKGTLQFFTQSHPALPDSLIYYDVDNNDFKFISRSKALKVNVNRWADYNSNELSWIKGIEYAIFSKAPFFVICSNANWLTDMQRNSIDDKARYFNEYIHKSCTAEIDYWKSLLIETKKDEALPLF